MPRRSNNRPPSPDPAASAEELSSPLHGKSLPRILLTIAIAIIVPGGLYVLAALVIVPVIVRFFLRRASRRIDEDNQKSALAHASRAVWLSRGSGAALAGRAALHLRLGDLDAALADAEQAVRRAPKLAAGYLARGQVYDERGDWAAALADYTRFIELHKGADGEQTAHARERIAALGGELAEATPSRSSVFRRRSRRR